MFAEQITGSIDIKRMKRVQPAHRGGGDGAGAPTSTGVRYFLDAGRDEVENFTSAQRVFRGVPTTGGAAFTRTRSTCAG